MAVDVTQVRKRVTEILNACSAGTFSEEIDSNNYQRNDEAINEAVLEASKMIAQAIIANPQHIHRNLFISSTPVTLTHATELPDMAGIPSLVEIEPYAGATWKTGVMRDVQMIESFRENISNLYDSVAHNASGSRLSGYFAIANGKFYFTGNAARGYIPLISDSSVLGLIPDEYQNIWVALSVGGTVKEGDNLMPIANYYLNWGLAGLGAISEMSIIESLPTVEQARKQRGNV